MPSDFPPWVLVPVTPVVVMSRHEDRMLCENIHLRFQATEPGTDNCRICALRRSSHCSVLCTDDYRADKKTGYWSGHKVRDS